MISGGIEVNWPKLTIIDEIWRRFFIDPLKLIKLSTFRHVERAT